MAGICGVIGGKECAIDLYMQLFYLQHRAQDYCGMFFYEDEEIFGNTHKGLIEANFSADELRKCEASHGVGSVSVTREPASGISSHQAGTLTFDGNVSNREELRDQLLKKRAIFSGYHFPEKVNDIDLIAHIVLGENSFEEGIGALFKLIKGDFAIVNLTKEGIYAARGFGRKPLILGKKNGSYTVSSESTSFINTGYEIVRDVKPGEVVFLNSEGIHTIKQFDLGNNVKYGTFEWIYTAYPSSIIDGKSVSEVRKAIGRLLAKKFGVEADIVSPVPNSGRWHALGYANESKIKYEEVFVRFDYSGRSFTPGEGERQQRIADTKLIPISSSIKGKRIILVDDSIVRGTQTKNQVARLRQIGAREVHARIACPPLMCACKYGQSTKKDDDCIARRMNKEAIKTSRDLDSLEYATVEMLEEAIGIPREKLCLSCWGI